MNSTNKTQTSTAKFEEFFATSYKDDVFEILEKYPDERSLTVNYQSLEIFDPDLADLLIDKPEEVIEAVLPRLSHVNQSVVMSAIKVIMKFMDQIDDIEKIKNYCKKLTNSIMSVNFNKLSRNSIYFIKISSCYCNKKTNVIRKRI